MKNPDETENEFMTKTITQRLYVNWIDIPAEGGNFEGKIGNISLRFIFQSPL